MRERTVLTEQAGRVLTVRLHNPPLNFLNSAMVDELNHLVRALRRDRTIGAVVLTGKPDRLFVTHADSPEILRHARAIGYSPTYRQARAMLPIISAAKRLPRARAALRRGPLAGALALQTADDTFRDMNRLDKVFIAAINGPALGGGLILALACDIRLIAEGNPVGLMESNIGFMAAAGGTQRATRLLGPGKALELLLDGTILTTSQAADLGLVNEIVPADDLLDRANELGARLAHRSPHVIRELKRAVYDGSTRRLQTGIRMEEASMLATAATPAAIRATTAYHNALGPLDQTTPEQMLHAWEALRSGRLT